MATTRERKRAALGPIVGDAPDLARTQLAHALHLSEVEPGQRFLLLLSGKRSRESDRSEVEALARRDSVVTKAGIGRAKFRHSVGREDRRDANYGGFGEIRLVAADAKQIRAVVKWVETAQGERLCAIGPEQLPLLRNGVIDTHHELVFIGGLGGRPGKVINAGRRITRCVWKGPDAAGSQFIGDRIEARGGNPVAGERIADQFAIRVGVNGQRVANGYQLSTRIESLREVSGELIGGWNSCGDPQAFALAETLEIPEEERAVASVV